jgi:hypothetical protein
MRVPPDTLRAEADKPGAVLYADRSSPRRHARELEKIAESVVSRYPAGKVIRCSEYELPRTRQPVEKLFYAHFRPLIGAYLGPRTLF